MVGSEEARTSVRPGTHGVVSLAEAGDEPTFTDALADARTRNAQEVIVDLGAAPMVSATTLTAIRRLGLNLRDRGGYLVVAASHPGLRRLLMLTLLDRSFAVVADVGHALDHRRGAA